MRLPLLLILAILLGISIQAGASNIRKASYPNPAIPTATAVAASKSTFSAPVPLAATATFTPVLTQVAVAITVWPSVSKGGQSILFKAPSDPGSTLQLTIQSQTGGAIFSTNFSRTSRSGGYVWRLQNQSDSPVTGGVYSYIVRFKQQGQEVTAQGKVTVIR